MGKYSKYVKTENLRLARISRRLTYRDMSTKLGFKSAASYYNIETGRSLPNIKVMNDISDIFGESVENFFNLEVQQRYT